MCILFIYTNPEAQTGEYRLIVASNRDEFYKRPAKKAFRCADTNIIGGRDMEPGREGGMWLGISLKPQRLQFGALLNVTGEDKRQTATSGRGPLVYNYLTSHDGPLAYCQILNTQTTYSAFNLVALELTKTTSSIYHHSNSPQNTMELNGRQCVAFGNSTPAAPLTKVARGLERFRKIVNEKLSRDELVEDLLQLLKCRKQWLPDKELQRRAPGTFESLSSIFVQIEAGGYGTRTHSVILVDSECNVEFIEHTMKEPIDIGAPEWEVTTIKAHL